MKIHHYIAAVGLYLLQSSNIDAASSPNYVEVQPHIDPENSGRRRGLFSNKIQPAFDMTSDSTKSSKQISGYVFGDDEEASMHHRQKHNDSYVKPSATNKHSSAVLMSPGLFVKLGVYYFALYFFTVVYNVSNKHVLNKLPVPATLGVIQLFLGIPLFLPLWLTKPPKNISALSLLSIAKISTAHALGNLATMHALSAGQVSFTHVIKSAEPLFSAALSAILLNSFLAWPVYLSLLPIIFGVALASFKDVSFSWFALWAAMSSNFFYQLRYVLSKQLIGPIGTLKERDTISAANLFRVVTIGSSLIMIPISLFLELDSIYTEWTAVVKTKQDRNDMVISIFISGFSYYIYNEIAFWILDLVHPITHAVGNTIKRVVLIVASVLIFRIPLNLQGAVGTLIAVAGSLLYAFTSHHYSSSQ